MKRPKNFKVPSLEEIQEYVLNLPVIKQVIDWSKTHSLPGFFSVPIYDVIVFVFNETRRFDLFTRANSIAFSFFLSIFPALLSLFTLLPYLQRYFFRYLKPGETFQEYLSEEIHKIMPGQAGDSLFEFVENIITKPQVGILSFSFILAIYFSSNGMMAMMQSFEKSYQTTFRKRSAIKKRLVAAMLTVLLGTLLIASFILIILGNQLIGWLGEYIELAGFSTTSIAILRWVVIILLFYTGIGILYRYGAATYRRFHLFSPGATLATILSLLTSVAFSVYIDEFGRYETYLKFYGSVTAFIILMLWIQLNSLILLVGFELNASIAVNRDLKQEVPEEEQSI